MTHHRDFIFDHSEAAERRHRINRAWTPEEKERAKPFDVSRLLGPDGEEIDPSDFSHVNGRAEVI